MAFDLDALRRGAEEGLAIAERATEGPLVSWHDSERQRGYSVCTVDGDGLGDGEIADTLTAQDAAFFADARTRAPNAYRAVIELCAGVESLRRKFATADTLRADASLTCGQIQDRLTKTECRLTEALADAARLRDEVQRIDQKLHATENMNAELAEACSNAIEEIDAWKAKYVAEKTMRQNAEQNEAEAREECTKLRYRARRPS